MGLFGFPSHAEAQQALNNMRWMLKVWKQDKWIVTCTNTRTGEWHRHSWNLATCREQALQPEQEVTLHYRDCG